MYTKKFLKGLFLFVTFFVGTNIALAGPYLPGPVQLLEDNDYEVWLTGGTGNWAPEADLTGTIAAGDLFAGVWEIQKTNNVPGNTNEIIFGPNDETFTGLFLIEADVFTDQGGFQTIDFKPTSAQNWNDIFGAGGIIDVASEFDVTTLQQTGAGTMALLFDNVTQDQADETLVPLGASASSYVSGDLQYELGFTGAAGTDEFWKTQGIGIFSPIFAPGFGANYISLNITEQYEGPDLLQHNYVGLNVVPLVGFNMGAQVQGTGDFTNPPAGAWNIGTNTNFYIQSVPEPTTMLLFGTGLVGLAGLGRRRKKANKA